MNTVAVGRPAVRASNIQVIDRDHNVVVVNRVVPV